MNQAPPGIKIGQVKKSTFDSETVNEKITGAKKKCC